MLLLGPERKKVHAALDKMHICTKPSLWFRCLSIPFSLRHPSILWQYAAAAAVAAAAVHSIFHTLMHNVYIKATGRVS